MPTLKPGPVYTLVVNATCIFMETVNRQKCIKMNSMKEISITGFGLSPMCRLCLSRGVTVLDMFSFSTRFGSRVANAVMKCAPVQIRSGDEMPNFICQKCHTRLEKTYQFQVQIIESEKTLKRYLEQLHYFDKKPRFENSIQRPAENPLIDNTNADITVKCDSLEHHDVVDLDVNWREKEYENSTSAIKIGIEMSLKSELKDEEDSIISPNWADDSVETVSTDVEDSFINIGDSKLMEEMNVNWKVEESANFTSACKSIEEMALKIEVKDESMDDGSLIVPESIDATVSNFSNVVSEISCEDTKVVFDHISGNSTTLRSSDVGENRENIGVRIENIPMDRKTHKRTSKVKSRLFKIKDTCKKRHIKSHFRETHKRARTSKKLNRCDVCKKCFTLSKNLNRHKLIHTGEKPYQCDICKKSFNQSGILSIHKLMHTGEKPFQCDTCKKCFSQLAHLNTHNLIHTGEKPYQCDICKKCFTHSGALNRHKLLHTGGRPYQCDICKKCFTQSGTLNRHKLLHTGEKPYQCDICKKCFTLSENLNRHKLIHTGEKPYQCDICKKCFTSKGNLNTHKLLHTGEKPYQCDICKKCFTQSSSLNTHKRIHTGEKPYECDICKKRFTRACYLKSHKRIHTDEKQY